MTNRIKAIIVGLAVAVATINVASAKSELASLTVTPLWPTNATPGNVVLYAVTIERLGQGLLDVKLSAAGMPEGTTVSFGPAPARFTGKDPRFLYFIMTVTGNQPPQTDSFAFTVTGAARNETITVTNTVQNTLRFAAAVPKSELVNLEVKAGGDVEIRGQGITAENYQIEATTDLNSSSWGNVGSSTADGNGRFTFIHTGAQAQTGKRFYRAVKVAAPTE